MSNVAAINFDQYDRVRPIRWDGKTLHLLDQRKLPFTVKYVACDSSHEVSKAIHALIVRGAPAIGISAAFGVLIAANQLDKSEVNTGAQALNLLEPSMLELFESRPTAVNLAWALNEIRQTLIEADQDQDWHQKLERKVTQIAVDDLQANRTMGLLGANLISKGSRVLTHCNTGSLATAGFGTALGVIRAGVATGVIDKVYAGETRPWLQGARLTAWELQQDGILPTLIADGAAAHLMKMGKVDWVIVGADRICANGDTANKIGTLSLAVAAHHFGVKVMVVGPSSTVDMETASGDQIEIEQRDPDELLMLGGVRTAALNIDAWNPVFDVTPAELISVIVTEQGVIESPNIEQMKSIFLDR